MLKFISAHSQFDDAQIVIVGFPLDLTVARPGTSGGPEAIRLVSDLIEEYSLNLKRGLNELAICDLGDIQDSARDMEDQLKLIASQINRLKGKRIVSLGGEHTISLPIVQSLITSYPELRVLQIDAHTDLRDSYEGKRLSHATVIRRIAELIGEGRVYQLGIRSGEQEDFEPGKTRLSTLSHLSPDWLNELMPSPVYLTIDIDVLDPAYAPGVGVPEPGGITTQILLELIYSLRTLNIIGFDLVEVSPPFDPGSITSVAAAKIIREAMLSFW